MTLIISFASPDFVLQVSDRMVTDAYTGEEVNANATKMVLFCNRMVFSFTGLGVLEGLTTDVWLSNTLNTSPDASVEKSLGHIVQNANRAALQREVTSLARKFRRLAFIGVGFVRTSLEEPFRSIFARVSNYHDKNGIPLEKAEYEFSLQYSIQKPRRGKNTSFWNISGHFDEIKHFQLPLKKCVQRGVGPTAPIRIFRETIRRVAERDKNVGKDLLVGMIPRIATEIATESGIPVMFTADGRAGMLLGKCGEPLRVPKTFPKLGETPVFLDMPADSDTGIQKSPLFVCPGSGSPSGFTTKPTPQGTIPEITVRSSTGKLLYRIQIPNPTPQDATPEMTILSPKGEIL